MKRRVFLRSAAASTLAVTLGRPLWALPTDHRYVKAIGLQLWTVRNQLDKDVPGTLAAVAAAGYQQVELMKVLDADKYLPAAKDNGLRVKSAFIDWQSIGNPAEGPSFDEILTKASQIGLEYLVFGYIGKGHRETIAHFQRHAERANQAGEKCQEAGIQLCYHNHSFEFAPLDGARAGWDVLVDEFDHELVKFELDVFWAAIGGRNPLTAMKPLKGRMAQLHLKDLGRGTAIQHDESLVPHEAFRELGGGSIDMLAILREAERIGVEQCHVEQDQSPDPIVSIGQSVEHLHRI